MLSPVVRIPPELEKLFVVLGHDLPDEISGFAHIYDTDASGDIDAVETALRAMANDVYSAINEQGQT